MEDTAWFEEGSVDDQLTHLSQLMYSGEENAKTNFKTLLNLVPVDLVKNSYNMSQDFSLLKGGSLKGFLGDH